MPQAIEAATKPETPCRGLTVAEMAFPTQKAAADHFSLMLRRYQAGQRVDDGDASMLRALLARHPEAADKIGCGIDHFTVRRTIHGTNCFYAERIDGSRTDFSIKACIAAKAPTRRAEVMKALREAVMGDIMAARDAFFAANADADGFITCGATGDRIAASGAHVDHLAPMTFEIIAETFLAGRGMGFGDVPITQGADNQVLTLITDKQIADDFRQYHNKVARLDVVARRTNLAVASTHRIKAGRVSLAA